MTANRLACLLVIGYAALTGSVFFFNLPDWCANQHIVGNQVIHPICK